MWYSKVAIGDRNGLKIRIYGDKASAEWIQILPGILSFCDALGRRWKIDRGNEDVEICNQVRYTRFKAGHPSGFIEAFANYYHDIGIALRKYKNNQILEFEECFSVDESLEGIRLMEAIQVSSNTKSWCDIPNI